MAQYGIIRCPICYAAIEWSSEEGDIEKCPACKERIKERLQKKGEGINTATTDGPGFKPLTDLEQDVY